MAHGNCPKCGKPVTGVTIGTITIKSHSGSWNGVTYNCEHCACVLTVLTDPVALKNDTIQGVLDGLRKD